MTDWHARVLEAVDASHENMLSLLADLVRMPSVSGSDEENSTQAGLSMLMDGFGFETDHWQVPLGETLAHPDFPGSEVPRTEAWGLVGRLAGAGDGPTLMLNAHLDVVPPGPIEAWGGADPFAGRFADGVIYGRGACDMKGGLVAALWAVSAIRAAGVPLRGDLLLATVQGEEDGGLGTFALLQRGWRADACVIPEPTSLDLVPANGGSLTFRLRIPGRATHASRRLEGVNAIAKLWPIWSALEDLERERNVEVDPLFGRWKLPYPLNLGTVAGGGWASSVPDLLIAEGRLGVAIGETNAAARTAFERAVTEACGQDEWLRDHPVEVEWWGGQFASGRLPEGDPLLGRMRAAHESVSSGSKPAVWGAPYGSDLRLMQGAGVPTLQYGPGDAALAHSVGESVPCAEVLTAARALAVLALDVCGL